MSVYIKGMEMPTEGEYYMTLYVCSDGSAYIDVASFPVDKDRFEAVPVPDHGRLISAFDTVKTLCDKGLYMHAEVVSDMPTIIPADKEGE